MSDKTTITVYDKINAVKVALLDEDVQKSGKNAFSKVQYLQLVDFIETINRKCAELRLFCRVSFNKDFANMEIIDCENTDSTVEYSCPITQIEMKGCNEMQSLGAVQTYARRYLYLMAFDIAVPDTIDSRADNTQMRATEEQLALLERLDHDIMVNGLKVLSLASPKELSKAQAAALIKKYNLS